LTDQPLSDLLHLFRSEQYQFRLKGQLSNQQAPLFSGLTSQADADETLLSGPIADQETLYLLLDHIRSLGLPLLSVARVEPDLEEVFLQILHATS
jgi:ABC-2 type transport system ATP-binding protein